VDVLINIQIDQQEVRQMYLEKLEEKIKEVDAELVFWDAKELMRRTGMSWNTIQTEFFFEPRFKKYKVGAKWRFPAEESKRFLLQWLSEQPKG
jgi:phage pi2 protein 07